MRTHVEFRSDAFPAEAGEEEAVNPGRWGTAVARFLRQELSNRGLPGREPVAEDWGYCIQPEGGGGRGSSGRDTAGPPGVRGLRWWPEGQA